MARQDKVGRAGRPGDEEALLVRSAELLGRMIGTLQRQLDDLGMLAPARPAHATSSGRADGGAGDAAHARPGSGPSTRKSARKGASTTAARRGSAAAKHSAGNRKSKRGASPAGARKSAARRPAAKKAARK